MSAFTPHTRFHRLARESITFEHWRLPVAAIVAAVAYLIVSVALVIGLVVVLAIAVGSFREIERFLDELPSADVADPGVFAFLMISVIVMVPCAWLTVRLIWPDHLRFLLSVEGRLRWRWMLRCGWLSLLVIGASIAVGVAAMWFEEGGLSTPSLNGRSALTIVLVLMLTPLQSAAEEYVYRGFGLQLVGSWVRSPVLPIVLTTLLFAASHLYNFWGLVDVAAFGAAAAWMTVRTGGLEAAIAAHAVNNVLLFVLAAVGVIEVDPEGSVRPVEVLPTVVSMGVLMALVAWQVTRVGLVTTRAPQPPPPPVTGHPPMPRRPSPVPSMWPSPAKASRHRPAYVPPNAPPYPGQLTDGWR